ncbi:late Embryogenesis Abundant 4-5 [Wolffia australiana]
MQSGKSAMAAAKEKAANVAASAQAGMEKTKAMAQEKGEKMRAHSPEEKEMAEERKQQVMEQAEINKQQAKEENAAEREGLRATGGAAAAPTTAGVAHAKPVGAATGTGRPTAAHNPLSGSTLPGHHQTGGGYT